MQFERLRIGVSRLADGTMVLTPFGRLGRVYRYEAALARRFERLMNVLLWGGAVLAAVPVVAGTLHRLDPRREAAAVVLFLIALDALRVLLVKLMFRRRETVERRPPPAAARDRRVPLAEMRRRALVPLLLAEAALFAVAVARLAGGEIDPDFPFALAACHGLVYANRHLAAATLR
jgi:hypothetical protein